MNNIELLNRMIKWHEERIEEKKELYDHSPAAKFSYMALAGEHELSIMMLKDLIDAAPQSAEGIRQLDEYHGEIGTKN